MSCNLNVSDTEVYILILTHMKVWGHYWCKVVASNHHDLLLDDHECLYTVSLELSNIYLPGSAAGIHERHSP